MKKEGAKAPSIGYLGCDKLPELWRIDPPNNFLLTLPQALRLRVIACAAKGKAISVHVEWVSLAGESGIQRPHIAATCHSLVIVQAEHFLCFFFGHDRLEHLANINCI